MYFCCSSHCKIPSICVDQKYRPIFYYFIPMLKLQVNIININSVQWKSSESTRVSTYPVVSWCSVNSSLWRHVWNSARQLLPVFQVTTIHGFTSVISIPTWQPAIHSARTNSSFISAKYRAVSHHFPLISVRCVGLLL